MDFPYNDYSDEVLPLRCMEYCFVHCSMSFDTRKQLSRLMESKRHDIAMFHNK